MLGRLEMAEEIVVLEVDGRQEQRVQHHAQQRQSPQSSAAPQDHLNPMIAQVFQCFPRLVAAPSRLTSWLLTSPSDTRPQTSRDSW